MEAEKNKYEAGDKVKFINETNLIRKNGSDYHVDISKSYEVVMPFTDIDGIDACLLKIDGFVLPFQCNTFRLEEKAPKQPDPVKYETEISDEAAAYKALQAVVDEIPPYSLGYVFNIDGKLVAAKSMEESIGIYHKEYHTQTIQKVRLLSFSNAMIQNEIPVI